jgi:hypothetical protein
MPAATGFQHSRAPERGCVAAFPFERASHDGFAQLSAMTPRAFVAFPYHTFVIGWCLVLLFSGCGLLEKRPGPIDQSPPSVAATNEPLRFHMSFPPGVRSNAASGRLLLFLSRRTEGEPRRTGMFGIDQAVYARDITNWIPGKPIVFAPDDFRGPQALAYPDRMTSLAPGAYSGEAILELDSTRCD